MATPNETRVRVEGFSKIIPSVRPASSSCADALALLHLQLRGEIEDG